MASQDLNKESIIKNKIKKVIQTSLKDSVTYSVEYLNNGLKKTESHYPFFIFGKNSKKIRNYKYNGELLIEESDITMRNDTVVTKTKTIYEYDSLNRIKLEFYSQDGFSDNEMLTIYIYSSSKELPYFYKYIYGNDSTSYGYKLPTLSYKNGKTYFLQSYTISFGEKWKNPTKINFYTKCDFSGNGIIKGFYKSSTQSQFYFGDSIKQLITTSSDGNILKSELIFYHKSKIIKIFNRDFNSDMGNESVIVNFYDANGLIKSSSQSINWKTAFKIPSSNEIFVYKYEFY